MSKPMWSGERSRKIIERIVIEGTLVLETPAHFGDGDDDGAVIGLLVDALDGTSPLLTGTSIAGALRSYLWSYERGYGIKQQGGQGSAASLLFGTSRDDGRDGTGDQSRLIVDDARGEKANTVYRDGVRLDEHSRTAAEDALYAVQLWDAGTAFPLRFELLITENDERERLLSGLLTALRGLENGEITLGARKRRGYGRVRVTEWRAREYAVHTVDGLMAWLREGASPLGNENHVDDLSTHIANPMPDERKVITLDAWFTLDGSLLIRSADDVTDMKHLAGSDDRPILSGTSITGALRARATKILNTLTQDTSRSAEMVNNVFGSPHDQRENRKGSRIIVEEHVIEGGTTEFVQSRVSIDRFTGGALEGHLFDQQPVFGSAETEVHICLQLRNPANHEIGLLLLLLKDLWTGDLTLGGERSVGRGRLRGEYATLTFDNHTWTIAAEGEGLIIEPESESLNARLQELLQKLEVSYEA